MIEDVIYSRLSGDADIIAYTSTRIYPWTDVPQNPTYPYIVFMRVGSDPIESLSGSSGLCYARIQIDVFNKGTTTAYRTAKLIAEEVRKSLQGFSGTVASIDVGGIRCLSDADDAALGPEHGQERGIARVMSEFMVGFHQAIPTF